MADEFNFGYDDLTDVIVQKINDHPVNSLTELEASLKNPLESGKQKFTKISLDDGNGEVILGYDDVNNANQRIMENYGIGSAAKIFSSHKK
jgi:hypothetical protein